MKWFDIPPVWLIAHIGAVWLLAPMFSWGFGMPGSRPLGTFLIIGGLSLMLMAVWEMYQAKTTPIPHMEPSNLVDSGVFAISRNPIYLGDALVLAGGVLWTNSLVLVLAVPLFVWIIQVRFIAAEEARLSKAFGAAFDTYCARTRRWI